MTAWHVLAIATLALTADAQAQGTRSARAPGVLPPGFVHLRAVDPSIVQDIRYAGRDNFLGKPLAGYTAAECILRRGVAFALRRVQADLAALGLGLKVFDCYRPQRAVREMVQWASDGRPDRNAKGFYPAVEKRDLLNGYISSHSLHSAGIAVDLTIVRTGRFEPVVVPPSAADCRLRGADGGVDMGTGYDCFDAKSRTRTAAITPEQKRWRNLLVSAMAKRGFKNYHREWWHFSFPAAAPGTHYDFPIGR